MVKAKYFYVYYAISCEFYGWGIRENGDEEFYNHIVNGTHPECYFEYGTLISERHIKTLTNLLNNTEDDREYMSIIQTFSEFI